MSCFETGRINGCHVDAPRPLRWRQQDRHALTERLIAKPDLTFPDRQQTVFPITEDHHQDTAILHSGEIFEPLRFALHGVMWYDGLGWDRAADSASCLQRWRDCPAMELDLISAREGFDTMDPGMGA
jgi:hypothetical protein